MISDIDTVIRRFLCATLKVNNMVIINGQKTTVKNVVEKLENDVKENRLTYMFILGGIRINVRGFGVDILRRYVITNMSARTISMIMSVLNRQHAV